MEIIIALLLVIGFFLLTNKLRPAKKKTTFTETIKHKKQEYLATENEKKLLFTLQKVLNKDKYLIHCQTSLIAIVDPINFKDKSRAYSKRMDFVITDTATKILAVIELDDSSHSQPKRIKRDKYVNDALNTHHPLIRIPTNKFYNPREIADILEKNANIKNEFNKNS